MSASEKLKALEAQWNGDSVELWADAKYDLIRALPQIRAVVEAAVAAEDALRVHGRGPQLIVSRHALHTSLAALDEALQ